NPQNASEVGDEALIPYRQRFELRILVARPAATMIESEQRHDFAFATRQRRQLALMNEIVSMPMMARHRDRRPAIMQQRADFKQQSRIRRGPCSRSVRRLFR